MGPPSRQMISALFSSSTGLSRSKGEEEKNSSDLITKMELFGSDAKALYMLNSELQARVYAAPSLTL